MADEQISGLYRPREVSIGVSYSVSTERLFTRDELDEFIAVFESSTTSESLLHSFLRNNPKFLFALGAYRSLKSEVTFPVKPGAEHLRLDFLLEDHRGSWDVVELKRASTGRKLIVGPRSRRHFAAELDSAIAQVRTYLGALDSRDVQEHFQRSGMSIVRPQAWLVVGRDQDFPIAERRDLEDLLPHRLRIVTYDDLTNLAKQRALIVTRPSIVLPRVDVNLFQSLPDWSAPPLNAITLMEDNPAILEFLKSRLEQVGYLVLRAENAADCDQLARAGCNAFILDVDMGAGREREGLTALENLKSRDPNVFCAVFTGHLGVSDAAKRLRCDAFLSKGPSLPENFDSILLALDRMWLGRAQNMRKPTP